MKQNLDPLGYDNINLLSSMTLDLPSVAHHKNQVSRAFRYARDFGSTTKEALKCKAATSWSAYYHTSCGSWCRVPESINTITSSDREVCARKSPWQGLEDFKITCIKRKFRLEKKSAFGRLKMPQTKTCHTEVSEFDSSGD